METGIPKTMVTRKITDTAIRQRRVILLAEAAPAYPRGCNITSSMTATSVWVRRLQFPESAASETRSRAYSADDR
jgi:hypothetical protein